LKIEEQHDSVYYDDAQFWLAVRDGGIIDPSVDSSVDSETIITNIKYINDLDGFYGVTEATYGSKHINIHDMFEIKDPTDIIKKDFTNVSLQHAINNLLSEYTKSSMYLDDETFTKLVESKDTPDAIIKSWMNTNETIILTQIKDWGEMDKKVEAARTTEHKSLMIQIVGDPTNPSESKLNRWIVIKNRNIIDSEKTPPTSEIFYISRPVPDQQTEYYYNRQYITIRVMYELDVFRPK
jgi:hypothetical protein